MYVLLAPVLVGGYLLYKGFSNGSYAMAGIGALVLGSAPIMAYIAWKRSY